MDSGNSREQTPTTLQPGQTISPQSSPAAPPAPAVVTPVTPDQAPPPAAASEPDTPPVAMQQPESKNTSPGPQPDSADPTVTPTMHKPGAPISWTASEFIAHDKSTGWYTALAGVTIVVAALVYLLTRDKISTGVVIVAAIAFGGYAARRPNQQQYALDDQGLHIGSRYFDYNEFRSFCVIDEGSFSSISFVPLKRFGQLISIYYDPADESAIIDLLSARLPIDQRGHDAFDRFLKRIRF